MVRLNLQMFAKSTSELAKEVIQGKWGNGQTRKTKLSQAGYNYSEVQAEVNKMMKGGSSSNATNTQKTTSAASNTLDAPKTPKINGADSTYVEQMASNFEVSDDAKKLEDKATADRDKASEYLSNTNIVDQSIYDGLGQQFAPSQAVTDAFAFIDSQYAQLQSGKTQYTDRYNTALDKYLNREDFEYDVDNDQLFQQALASAMNSGKSAMQDTIGQASALTGGYGSTYATTAGNQAYNAFIEDAYNNLPEYYQMALEAYQAEGQELYNQVALLGDADANEWQKMYNSLSMGLDIANSAFDRELTMYDTNIDRLTALGNLQLSENSQVGNNLFNAAQLSDNAWQNKYAQEFDSWKATVEQATNIVQIQNSDYWENESLQEQKRQFDQTFNASYEEDGNGGYRPKSSKTGSNSTLSLSDTEYGEIKKMVENGATEDEVLDYLAIKGKVPTTEEDDEIVRIAMYGSGASGSNTSSGVNADGSINWKNVDIEMADDTMNGFLGLGALVGHYDTNDTVIVNGKAYKTSEIHNMLDKDTTLSETERILLKKNIRDLSKGEVYNFSKKNSK